MIDIESIQKRTEELINNSSTEQLMADVIECGLGDSEYEDAHKVKRSFSENVQQMIH